MGSFVAEKFSRMLLCRMRDEPIEQDLTFIVGNDRFPAVRNVIAAASPVLRTMLTNGMIESKRNDIALRDLDSVIWRKVLDFIYTAKIHFRDVEEALDILECAHRFEIETLESGVAGYLRTSLNSDNCTPILVAADRYSSKELKNAALIVYSESFSKLSKTHSFTELNEELVKTILKRGDLTISYYYEKFEGAMNWLVRNKERGVEERGLPQHVELEIAKSACKFMYEEGMAILEPKGTSISCGITQMSSSIMKTIDLSVLDASQLKRVVRFARNLANDTLLRHKLEMPIVEYLFEKGLELLLRSKEDKAPPKLRRRYS